MNAKPKQKFKREIPVRYSEKQLGEEIVGKIISWYKSGHLSISRTLRRINTELSKSGKAKIDYVDIYSVLYMAFLQNKVPDKRTSNYGELTLKEFSDFFTAWKKGLKYDDCVSVLSKDGKKVIRSHSFIRKVHASLSRRWRETNIRGKPVKKEEIPALEVFKYAKRAIVHNKPCIVIYLHDLPKDLLNTASRHIPHLKTILKSEHYSQEVVQDRISRMEKTEDV